MAYIVDLTDAAIEDLHKLPVRARSRVQSAIDGLEKDARPHGSLKMSGIKGTYRIRVGDYRIVYAVRDEALLVLVVAVGERQDMYGLKLMRRIRKSVSDWEGS